MIVSQFYSLSDTFKFGQYKGMALSDVIDWDYQYIYWCMNSISNMEFLIYDSAIEELKQVYPHFYISNDFENNDIVIYDTADILNCFVMCFETIASTSIQIRKTF